MFRIARGRLSPSPRKGGSAVNEIYVTGHRNPDTDSIVASLAYANLRRALGTAITRPCASAR